MMRWTVGLLIGFCFAPLTFGQSTEDSTDWHFRYEYFRSLFEDEGLKVTTNVPEAFDDPEDTVLIQVGRLEAIHPQYVRDFCQRGGAALVATDDRYNFYGVGQFVEGPVRVFGSEHRYQGFEDCISINSVNSLHPLMLDVNQLVLNRSGWLTSSRWGEPDWKVAFSLPEKTSQLSASESPVLATTDSFSSADGRLALCADPSVFTNGMMWHGDNAQLAVNMARYLIGDGRKRVVFVVDNRPLGSFRQSVSQDVLDALPPPIEPPASFWDLPLPLMAKAANEMLGEVQNSNVLNEALADRPRNLSQPRYLRLLIFILTGIALMLLLRRLISGGRQQPGRSLVRQMKSAQVMQNERITKSAEYGHAASMLARELCVQVAASSDPADWVRRLKSNAVVGSDTIQKRYRGELSDVVDMAVNTQKVHLSEQRFLDFGRTLSRLRQLHDDEKLFAT